MLNTEWIERTEAFLREKLEGGAYLSAHPEERDYRLAHSFRVANIGRRIALSEGFDETETVIACLLHDVSYCEEFGEDGWRSHGRRAARIARPFLTELGLPADRIREICYGIAIHVDDEADFPGERTPFALTVGDADNIDRFDVYRIHEALCHEGFLGMCHSERLEFTEARIRKLRELETMPMGTRTAAAMWRERVSFYLAFYERLLAQLRDSEPLTKGGTGKC